jgi:hypothetical protein
MGLLVLVSVVILVVTAPEVYALIRGGEGNTPIPDPGWPAGAAAVFNVPSRIAWWDGAKLGGGLWHAECRGDAKALSAVLADFAKIDVKSKQVVLHDGVGNSFWLNPNKEPAKRDKAKMDWSFTVWQSAVWKQLHGKDADGQPSQIDVYTGGNIKWADVTVPKGLTIVDQRLEAHGFTLADGVVLEGKVTDLATKKPVAAKVRLQPLGPQPKGGNRDAAVVQADADGHWVLKKVLGGGYRVVLEAEGYVPRVVGYLEADDQPRWHAYDGSLARPATVAGRVTDDAGRPLADADLWFENVRTSTGEHYESALGSHTKTGADGRFRTEQFPVGRANIWVHKPGYCRPGLGLTITTPKEDVALTMTKAGRVVVTVDFTGAERPAGYIVMIAPEGGEAVGKYGGSGQINQQNQITFDNVPPARYVLRGRPNPGSVDEETDPITVDLQGGKTTEIKLRAK